MTLDTGVLKDSFAAVAGRGPELAEFFYGVLFLRGGQEVRDMFPPTMSAQRDRLLHALVQIVTSADDMDRVAALCTGLGADHRKFAVQPGHYPLVGEALLATLAHFAGDAWTPEVASTWADAYALIAQVMQDGANAGEGQPPWWDAVITQIEHRPPDVAILRVRLAEPMDYAAGQSVAVSCDLMPRVWRFYSPATAPDGSGELVFHIKVIDGGLLSPALAHRAAPGERLRLGPPAGSLALEESARDVLMVAGSTGLAPLAAMIGELARHPAPPGTALFFGAKTAEGLYDLPALGKMAAGHPWLSVTAAAEGEPDGTGAERGSVVDVMARAGNWADHEVYVCGPSGMVRAAQERLASLGLPASQVHTEDFGLEGE
jgi:NAD(P)H-flavin reductase